MAKPLARSLLLASTLVFMGCNAQEPPAAPPLLIAQEAGRAQVVSSWLQAYKSTDQKDARYFFELGLAEKQKGNWSAATKAFAESMIRYPGPRVLAEYADADLRMLAAVRKRNGDTLAQMPSDMAHVLDYYRAALASNQLLGSLTEDEQRTIQGHADCLDTYLASRQVDDSCTPLRHYASGR